jgi:phosphoglycolate phosphatase-like HAD superfamily hydrolase
MVRRAVLFDIDGTLIRSHGSGMRAFAWACGQVLGADESVVRSVVPDGKTDPLILAEVLALVGGTADAQAVRTAYVGRLDRELRGGLERGEIRVLPGVPALLAQLEGEGEAWALGVGTGNWSDGAEVKLRHAGLGGRFAFGGYGEDGATRADVIAEGARRAGPADEVVVVGDTVRDVEAARACGFRVVAVGTGASSDITALRRSRPDVLLDDLSDLDAAYRALTGGKPPQSQR